MIKLDLSEEEIIKRVIKNEAIQISETESIVGIHKVRDSDFEVYIEKNKENFRWVKYKKLKRLSEEHSDFINNVIKNDGFCDVKVSLIKELIDSIQEKYDIEV